MMHSEYLRISPNADTAFLFIHGILGTPNHFAPLLPLLQESISIYNLLLDGHGKDARDFARSSMKKWEVQVNNAINFLSANHKKIFVVAHSMGTLLAIEEAINSDRISELFLIAVPIKVFLKPKMFITSIKLYRGKIAPDDKTVRAAQYACGTKLTRNPLCYLTWIPRYLELFSKIRRIRKILPRLNTPCTAFQSRHDEMVSSRSISILQRYSGMRVHILPESGHYYYAPNDLAFLMQEFSKFADKNRSGD